MNKDMLLHCCQTMNIDIPCLHCCQTMNIYMLFHCCRTMNIDILLHYWSNYEY